MVFLIHIPQYPLSRFIECLWYSDQQIAYTREKILPTGNVELMINFGAGFKLFDKDKPDYYNINQDSWLVGMQTEYLLHEPIAETHMLGVRFKPGGAYPFFGVPLSEFTNQNIEMDLIWGRFISDIRDHLYEAESPAARFAIAEHYLLERMNLDVTNITIIQHAVQEITQSHGTLSIKTLSEDIGISQKHLITQFKRVVGLSPKGLARIYRFQHVLNSIDPQQPLNWIDIAHQNHYYDQSHFNKDFMAFTGLSPTMYVEIRRAIYGDDVQKGQGIHFVPIG